MAYETTTERQTRYQKVCEEYELPDILERDGVRLFKNGPNRYKAPCPLGAHKGKNRGNFSVFLEDGKWFYHCMSCKASGDVITWVKVRNGLDAAHDAVQWLVGGVPSPQVERTIYTPPTPAPLPKNKAEQYHAALWQNRAHAQWWQAQGLSLAAIEHFKVGYCSNHQYEYWDGDSSENKIASYGETYTIPVYNNGELVNIRHRIKSPRNPHDKYRPESAGLGAHIFNLDVLTNPRTDKGSILILAGEKKVMVLHDHWNVRHTSKSVGIIPIISATAGATSWYGRYAEVWPQLLSDFEKVYIGFDPGEEDQAERTAMLFGRRSHIVSFPGKPDDLLVDDAEDGMYIITECIGRSEPLRSKSYWLSQGK